MQQAAVENAVEDDIDNDSENETKIFQLNRKFRFMRSHRRVLNFLSANITDRQATLEIYYLRFEGIIALFFQHFPNHKNYIPFKKISNSAVATSVYKNAAAILFDPDTSQNYPSLGEWMKVRGWEQPIPVRKKNYEYVVVK
jgi:hypothetical protein